MLLQLLPSQCSELIKEHGVPLRKWMPGSENVALARNIALKILEEMADTNIAVLGGDVVCIRQDKLKYIHENWYTNRISGEETLEFSKRSQDAAREYILKFQPKRDYEPLFVLVLEAFEG